MQLLNLQGVYKSFPISKNESFCALSNINLSFEECGFYSIVGKSGCGKTTLINMICRFDKPTKGEIYFNKQPYKYKNKNLYKFFRKDIGIVSQHYNLLTDLTVIENVILPSLISGHNKKIAKEEAIKLLEFVNIPKELYDSKANTLSGGESQRVAIARALINNPKIIVCDEPTGALDSTNSIKIMELLSKISKSKLVIMASHNLQLVNNYSNIIIEMSDGSITKIRKNIKFEPNKSDELITKHKKINWTDRISSKNFRKRIKRNLFVVASLSISMVITNLVVGFICGKDVAIKNACYRQFDFGYGSISKDEVVSNTGVIKLTKSIRPNLIELRQDIDINKLFNIRPNFSAILPSNIKISFDELAFEDISYTPIYSFKDKSFDRALLSKGSIPVSDSLKTVLINKKCYEKIYKESKIDPLNQVFHLSHKFESTYVSEFEDDIKDTFEFEFDVMITGIVDELTYLNTPKIYYSYSALENYMQEYILTNLSTYYDSDITWFDRVMGAEDYSIITSYSYSLFPKDFLYRDKLFDKNIFKEYTFNSYSLLISNSLIGFLQGAEYALFLFLGIGLLGTFLILMIISFTNYSEDRKVSAILTSLGAKNSDIEDIYVNENLYSAIVSLLLSFALAIPFKYLINHLIYKYINVENIIDIPVLRFLNIPLLYPLFAMALILVFVFFATYLPIKFSKSSSLSLELKVND